GHRTLRWRDRHADSVRRLQVDEQFELCRLFYRQVTWPRHLLFRILAYRLQTAARERSYSPALPVSPGVTVTCASPENPRTLAAAGLTSIIRPRTKGPRSLTVTTTKRPLLLLVTFTFVPSGRVRCAAVRVSGVNFWPVAVPPPLS